MMGNQRCWSPVCWLKGVHVSTHWDFKNKLRPAESCWMLITSVTVNVERFPTQQSSLESIIYCSFWFKITIMVITVGSDFSGLECLSWACRSLCGVKFCPWCHSLKLLLGSGSKQELTRFDGSSPGPFPPALRKAGLDYRLSFISEANPSLRSLVESIHQPKCVYEELWIASTYAWRQCHERCMLNCVQLRMGGNEMISTFMISTCLAVCHHSTKDATCRNIKEMPKVMLYGAGPPCQGVSSAGKKRGMEPGLMFNLIVFFKIFVLTGKGIGYCDFR